jgi:PAS domain S-box-containing protein
VIASKTDKNGVITYVSDAFCLISGYDKEELLGKTHSIVRHHDMPKDLFESMWETLKSNQVWKGEIKNRKKDGGFYWVEAIITPECDDEGLCGYSAIRQDITAKKEVEELSRSLEQKVLERTKELDDEKTFVNSVMNSQSSLVIATDGEVLRSSNQAFRDFFEVESEQEFIERYGNCICDTFVEEKGYISKKVASEKWVDYVKNHSTENNRVKIIQNEQEYIFTVSADSFEFQGATLKTAVFNDITELENVRRNIELILSNILLPVLITSVKDRTILYANKYALKQYEATKEELIGKSIDTIYTKENQKEEILAQIEQKGYVENLEQRYKTLQGREFPALLSVKPLVYDNHEAIIGMIVDITKQKQIEAQIKAANKHVRSSIDYASLIQHSLIPDDNIFYNYFSEFFALWHPKDIVGGDIYLFEELRGGDECLLMVIDCTGHGVPGAFVTMLVKAIERQVVGKINSDPTIDVSPAWILSYFNKTMKKLLGQESEESISNAGFDGGVLYYNKKQKVVKFSGAQTPLFYIDDGKMSVIKSDKHSIGYKKSDADFAFQDHIFEAKEEMEFYITTDGYLDQNGGEKGFPFGKKRFRAMLEESQDESLADKLELLLLELDKYQKEYERNDDITVVGVKI